MKEQDKTFDARFVKMILPFLVIVIFIMLLPWLVIKYSWFGLNLTDTGSIGDTLGGIIGPFVAIVAAFLTFLAFWVQYKANEQLRYDIRIDRLENKIYEMLNIHRQNVSELSLKDFKNNTINGRNIFPHLYVELKRTYKKLEEVLIKNGEERSLNEKELLNISYIFFYIGIKSANREYLRKLLVRWMDRESVDALASLLDDKQNEDFLTIGSMIDPQNFLKEKFHYEHFSGHFIKLSHYYRHLLQIIKYIDEVSDKLLNEKEKYSYMKVIRAQLSSFEQLLLYYGSLSIFGQNWNSKKYLTKYRLIKNMPLPLADFGILPEKEYADEIKELRSKGIELFDWNR